MLRVIRFLLFIAALMVAVYQAGAQDVPPEPFTLYTPVMQNPHLFRMDHTVGCSVAGLEEHQLWLVWQSSEWNSQNPNPDTSDHVSYEVVFRIDSALSDGSITKVERTIISADNGTRAGLYISGQELYDLLWTDGVPVQDRTDSLVMEVQYYVVAMCSNHGLKTYSDTAGVSIESPDVPHVTPPLVVSINRPPTGPTTFFMPQDDEEIYHIENIGPVEIIWHPLRDVNIQMGLEQSLFHAYNSITHSWETVLAPGSGLPARTVDTVVYQWYGVVTEAWPKPSPVAGTALVKNTGVLSATYLDINDLDALFRGMQTGEVDSIRIEHCVLAKDAEFYGTSSAHHIEWPYQEGIWQNGLKLTPGIDTSLYSEFGCAPHIVKGTCGSFTLKKGGPTTVIGCPGGFPLTLAVRSYPNPFTEAANITYTLPTASNARLSVYDMLGREVAVLHEGPTGAGEYSAQWTPSTALSHGMYMLVLTADGARTTTPIVMHQ